MTQTTSSFDRLETWLDAQLPRYRRFLLFLLFAFYVVFSLRSAAIRPLWYDEIFTLHLASYDHFGELWQNLRAGTDLNPPVYYVLVHASIRLFGDGEAMVRLPSIVGFGVLVLCVYQFVARRHGPLAAWLAALFLLGSNLSGFAYEARPYAVALGFAGLALLCWQSAVEKTSGRLPALVGLAVCLALALSTHYYAVLLFVPLGLAEVMRTLQHKRADWRLWLALAMSALPLAIYLPLMAEAKHYSVGFWAKPSWEELEKSYLSYISQLSVPLVGTLLVVALAQLAHWGHWPPEETPRSAPETDATRSPESVLLAGLAVLPVVGILLGQFVTGVFTPRYAAFTVLGLSVLFGVAVNRLLRGSPRPAFAVVLTFAAWFLVQGEARYRESGQRFVSFAGTCLYLREHTSDDVPFVLADCHEFLQMTHYDHVLARRTTYVTSLDLPLRYDLQNTSERGLRALSVLTPLRLEEFDTFAAAPRKFLLFGKNPWLLNELQKRGARLLLLGDFGEDKLFEVETYPHESADPAGRNVP